MITYEAELNFLKSILGQFNLSITVSSAVPTAAMTTDFSLQRKIFGPDYADAVEQKMRENLKKNTIYRITDEFFCSFFLMLMPEYHEPTVLVVGPYVKEETDRLWLERLLAEKNIDPQWTPILESHFRSIPRIGSDRLIVAAINSLAERIWGLHQFTTEEITGGIPHSYMPLTTPPDGLIQEDILERTRRIERAYQAENQFMEAIQQGRIHRAELMLSNFTRNALENRTTPLRNIKNYSIILNTLMRKAVEKGGVHPIQIDRLSSEFARRIESTSALEEFMDLWQDMARKYCLLVRSRATTSYSQLVQYIIARVDYDLTADLSLKANAEALNVNASYLSALFKRETGSTLTDYVNRKRVEHAVYLLASTDLPISAVAQRCGIQDDNYFTKIFKKYVSVSPKQYRQHSRLQSIKTP